MTKDDLNITDRNYIESRLRYFKRRGETQKARNLMYKHLLACKIDPTICVDGKYLPLIKEHGEDSLTPLYSLPRVMSAPFQLTLPLNPVIVHDIFSNSTQLTLCWNQVIAHEVFSKFIQHAFSTLRSLGLDIGNSEDYIIYLKYLQECLVGLKTFDVSAAEKIRTVNEGYSSQSSLLWHAFIILEKWSGLTASYNLKYSGYRSENVTKLIYLAVAKVKKKRPAPHVMRPSPSHISDEDSTAEMEWQKSLLLKYLFGIPISENDLKDDRPISPRTEAEKALYLDDLFT